jgi:hypothetical protein
MPTASLPCRRPLLTLLAAALCAAAFPMASADAQNAGGTQAAPPAPAPEQNAMILLINRLVERGGLTKQDAAELTARANADAADARVEAAESLLAAAKADAAVARAQAAAVQAAAAMARAQEAASEAASARGAAAQVSAAQIAAARLLLGLPAAAPVAAAPSAAPPPRRDRSPHLLPSPFRPSLSHRLRWLKLRQPHPCPPLRSRHRWRLPRRRASRSAPVGPFKEANSPREYRMCWARQNRQRPTVPPSPR